MAMLPDRSEAVLLAGAMNFRDLGGYHTHDGRRTRNGLVFRSNSLQELTGEDLEILRANLRVATVLDLRSAKEIARDGLGPFVDALHYVIADEHNLPLVFHCSAGKDRTGVLAALVLGCLGVDPETVVADYAALQDARDEIVAFLRRRPTYTDIVDDMDPKSLESEPGTMREFLRILEDRHGGARGWALEHGMSEAALRRLEELLLEPGD